MKDNLVSLVVPIYKVEKYLDRCIGSIVSQTYRRIEIILVDDGSPDRCPQICEEWAEKDRRIKVIHKINAGVGQARNSGMDAASGEYVIFVDGDDYIDQETVEKSMEVIQETGAQIVRYGDYDVDYDGTIVKKHVPAAEKNIFSGREIIEEYLPELIAKDYTRNMEITGMSACLFCYSMELIRKHGWRFVSERNIISEDSYSILKLYSYVDKVALVPHALYYYCRNEGSSTRRYRKDRYEQIKIYYDKMLENCDECGYPEEIQRRIASIYLSFVIAAFKLILRWGGTPKEKYDEMDGIIRDIHMQRVMKSIHYEMESRSRKVVINCIRRKQTLLLYLLFRLRTGRQGGMNH